MAGPTESADSASSLTFETLEAKWLAVESRLPDDLRLRLRRSLSWLGRAGKEMAGNDHDAAFIFYWIAFNAAYQKQYSPNDPLEPTERELFAEYFHRVIGVDSSTRYTTPCGNGSRHRSRVCWKTITSSNRSGTT